MNTPDSHVNTISPATWVPTPGYQSAGESRLVVVISGVSEEAALAARILAQAKTSTQPVLLFGVAATPEGETDLRRNLATVEAFIGAHGHPVELRSVSGRSWLERVSAECRPSDQVACYEEGLAGTSNEPFSDLLVRTLQVPVLVFSGLRNEPAGRRSMVAQAGAWLGSIGVIAGFLVLEARIVLAVQGWTQGILLLLTFLVEVELIWLWNSVVG